MKALFLALLFFTPAQATAQYITGVEVTINIAPDHVGNTGIVFLGADIAGEFHLYSDSTWYEFEAGEDDFYNAELYRGFERTFKEVEKIFVPVESYPTKNSLIVCLGYVLNGNVYMVDIERAFFK